MSYSVFFNRWLNRLYKSIAILLVLFAVLLSAFRLFLPYAHNYKLGFEDYLNQNYQSNIDIGNINMGWGKFGPTLIAEDVQLLQTYNTRVDIDTIDVRINFWQSLSEQTIVADHITLTGMSVVYDKTLNLPLVKNDKLDGEQALLDNLGDLFLTQISRFSLTESNILVNDINGQRRFIINHLNWLNKGDNHRASGDVRIDGLSNDQLKLLIDLQGEDKAELNGQVYLQAKQLNITPWLDSVFAIDNDKTDSDINFDAWLTINQGDAESLQVKLGENQVSWLHNGEDQQFNLNQGNIYLKSTEQEYGYKLHTSPLHININGQPWQPVNIEVSRNQQELLAYISHLDLATSSQVFPLLVENAGTRKLLEELTPKGYLADVQVQVVAGETQAVAAFSDASVEFSQGIPGMDNLSGQILFAKNVLKVGLNAQAGALDFDKHFIKPIPYNNIDADLLLTFDEQGIVFDATDVSLVSDELALTADVRVNIPKEGLAEMALLASIKDGNAAVAEHYYPHLLMGKPLVDYLNRGIVDGKIAQAQVLFNGPFAKFPFTEPEGIFVVDAELVDGTFVFDSQWPSIKEFSANLNFTNNGMLITGRAGKLSGLDVKGVEAGIADFSKGILTVDVDIDQANPEHVTDLMLASSLKDTVGATLEHVKVEQPISGWFNLNLPLAEPEKVVASGQVNFANNTVTIAAPEIKLTGAQGQLTFKNDLITVKQLSANWLGMPLSFKVDAQQQQDFYGTNINMTALWQEAHWKQHVPELLQTYSAGTLAWQGDLSLNNHLGGGFSYNLEIDSNLAEAELKLPQPYDKTIKQEKAFNIDVSGHLEQSTFNATLGKQLSFYGVLDHQDAQFTRAHLVLGDEQMLLPMDGFHITTKLEKAKLSQWQPFITDILDSIKAETQAGQKARDVLAQQGEAPLPEKKVLFTVPERIRGTIEALDVVGMPFNNVSFNLLDKDAWWLLQFNAKEARTDIKFYPDWFEQGVDVNADFFHLPALTEETESNPELLVEGISAEKLIAEKLIPDDLVVENINDSIMANFPPLTFHSDSLTVGLLDLGVVDFTIERDEPDKLFVKQFRAQRNKSELIFDMNWEHNQQGSQTQIIGKADVKDIEVELEKFEFASMIKESGAVANFDFAWQGAPQDFSVLTMVGDLSIDIDDGYLADVGDTARIFSVLSLQSLVRKLTLDFRDIFSDGMFYSSIKGDFDLKDGYLYTNNIKMNGAAGDLQMKGNTNLDLGLLDYSMSYKPNLTSSLPVLAWIATLQPAVFLAGIAIDQVMTSQVVSEFNFELTGNLDEPNFKEVDRKTMDISVGRSTPPTIVDNTDKNSPQQSIDPNDLENPAQPSDDKIKSKNLSQDNDNG